MKNFRIYYEFTGSVNIEAESEEHAKELFDKYSEQTLYEHAGKVEISEVIEES